MIYVYLQSVNRGKTMTEYTPPRVTKYGEFEDITRGQGSLGGDGKSGTGPGEET